MGMGTKLAGSIRRFGPCLWGLRSTTPTKDGNHRSALRTRRRFPQIEVIIVQPAAGGLLAWIFGPMFRLVRRSWQMFPIGFLFGLGFDTATEVALLSMSATQATTGLSTWSILVLPALFAAGMSLVDTANGVLMLSAYNGAFTKPIRKLHYNLMITFMSVIVAFAISGIQALGLVGGWLGLSGELWDVVETLSDNFNLLGFTIVGFFLVVWIGSVLFYRSFEKDDLEIERIADRRAP